MGIGQITMGILRARTEMTSSNVYHHNQSIVVGRVNDCRIGFQFLLMMLIASFFLQDWSQEGFMNK